MRILLLTQKLALPLQDGYNLRTYHYARHLGARHELHLFSLDEGAMPPELESSFASLTRFPMRPVPAPRALPGRLFDAFSPDHIHDFDPRALAAVENLGRRLQPDLIWSMGWKMLPLSSRLTDGVPVFADVIDEAVREARIALRRRLFSSEFPRRFKSWLVSRRYERKFFPHAAIAGFVSEIDAEEARRLCPGLAVAVVHNGVDAEHYAPMQLDPAQADSGPSLVFEGGMHHPPNVEGIVHFCAEILPRIRAAIPQTRLAIVGRDPLPEVRALAGPLVEVTGWVADVRPYVARATLFISPLIGGAGIKNKILQAWSMEKAVVCTPLSCGGLRVVDGENVAIAAEPAAFAAACIELLGNAERRRELGRAGRRTVLAHYTWEAKARELEVLLERAAGRGGA